MTSFATAKMTSLKALDERRFYTCKMLQIYVNVCEIVQILGGFLQCNGEKLEEAEYFKCVYCVFKSK